jgi:large subunit ribosomal protein L19
MPDLIQHVEQLNRTECELDLSKLPPFKVGDTLRIEIEVTEGNKTRQQPFQALCIRRSGGGHNETFTLRRVASGVGVERTFQLLSPKLKSLKVVRHGKVRRARLYYLRDKVGKAGRVKEATRER